MIETYPDHWQIIRDSISGHRTIDEQTYASLAVLSDRLERVRKLGLDFADVGFSPAVEKLKNARSEMAVA